MMDNQEALCEDLRQVYDNIDQIGAEQLEDFITQHEEGLRILPLQEYERALIIMYLSSAYREFMSALPL